jgi:Phage integrase family
VLDAKTPAGVRHVDIHDDLQEELAAHKAARGAAWQPREPAFVNARGKRWTRNAIAQHVIPPALEEANRQRTKAGLPEIREEVTPHTLRSTCIASLFAAGADQEYVADQVGHEDVTTTNRIYRYVPQRRRRGEIGRRRQLAMHESAAEWGGENLRPPKRKAELRSIRLAPPCGSVTGVEGSVTTCISSRAGSDGLNSRCSLQRGKEECAAGARDDRRSSRMGEVRASFRSNR